MILSKEGETIALDNHIQIQAYINAGWTENIPDDALPPKQKQEKPKKSGSSKAKKESDTEREEENEIVDNEPVEPVESVDNV